MEEDPDSFHVSSIGPQASSLLVSSSGFTFSRAQRAGMGAGKDSPGPVYTIPDTMGSASTSVFGTGPQRSSNAYPYPPSSVDLTLATGADPADLRFHSARGTVFGTEARGESRNAELLRCSPETGYGKFGPGFVYNPNDRPARPKSAPAYSIRTRTQAGAVRPQTPNRVGPNSYRQAGSIGPQTDSRKKTAPRSTFGRADRFGKTKQAEGDVAMQTAPVMSCFGRQNVAGYRSQPSVGFGTATRSNRDRTSAVMGNKDGGPVANMLPPRMPHPKTAPVKEQIRYGFNPAVRGTR